MPFVPWKVNVANPDKWALGPINVIPSQPNPVTAGLLENAVVYHVIQATSARFAAAIADPADPKIIIDPGGGGPCGEAAGTCPPVPPPPEVTGAMAQVTLFTPIVGVTISIDKIELPGGKGPIAIIDARNDDTALTEALTVLPAMGATTGQVFWLLQVTAAAQWRGTLGVPDVINPAPIDLVPTDRYLAIPVTNV